MMKNEETIIKMIGEMQGQYTPYIIFSDWVAMTALAIQNACTLRDEAWKKREDKYLEIANKYSVETLFKFAEMTKLLTEELEEEMRDVLGSIFMKAKCGSAATGQFFTPYHLSKLTAEVAYSNEISQLAAEEVLRVLEPSCGGGGMMIAIAEVMKEKGIDYQTQLDITAKDLDWNGVYMTYVQLSLLGIKATVIQGDSLTSIETEKMITPRKMGVIL